MIPMKKAVLIAIDSLKDLYPESRDHRLEQAELDSGIVPKWNIVISYRPSPIAALIGPDNERLFKEIVIGAADGDQSVKALRMFKW